LVGEKTSPVNPKKWKGLTANRGGGGVGGKKVLSLLPDRNRKRVQKNKFLNVGEDGRDILKKPTPYPVDLATKN